MSKQKTIQNALPIVAAAYGEKFGVKISIGGDTAFTDGKAINIPNIPHDYPHQDVVWGYLAHEAAHVKFTDFSVQRQRGLHADLSNILEDCRIEREMIKELPGTARTLKEVACYMAQAGHYSFVTNDSHPASIISAVCLYWLQSKAVGQSVLEPYLASAQAALDATFPKGVVVRLNALLRKAVATTSTQEAVDLATQIMKMIKEEKQKEEENQQQQSQQNKEADEEKGDQPDEDQPQNHQQDQQTEENQSGQDGQSGDSEEDEAGDESSGAGNNGTDEDDSEQNKQGDGAGGDSQEESDSSSSGAGDGDQDAQQGNGQAQDGADAESGAAGAGGFVKVLQDALDADEEDLLGDAREALRKEFEGEAQKNGDSQYQTVRTAIESPKRSDSADLVNSVKGTTAKIRSQLYGLVQASQRTGSRIKHSGKRLDTRRLHRVAAGDTRIFHSPEERVRPNTAVHVLVDLSSSMSSMTSLIDSQTGETVHKTLADVAREAAMALAMALEPIQGVNAAVSYFLGDYSNNTYRPTIYSVVKHGQKVVPNAGRFMLAEDGGTPMAEAIWYGAYQLSKTREQKKMIICVTDGAPDDATACKAVIDLCERGGFEMVGIGIKTASVSRLFQKNIVIQDVHDLKKTLFKLMERSLIESAA